MVAARPASTVIVFRRTPVIEVLIGLRPPGGVFGGIWAFPGGAVDAADADPALVGFDDPHRAAALRETAEEVGIYLTDPPDLMGPDVDSDDVVGSVRAAGGRFDPGRLRYVSTWITPEGLARRYDTRFYLAEVHPDTPNRARTEEFQAVEWVEPSRAVTASEAGERAMLAPTVWHLGLFGRVDDPWSIPEYRRHMPPVTDDRPWGEGR